MQSALSSVGAGSAWRNLASFYVPPTVRSYTDACEAPIAMWNGAITLMNKRVVRNGVVSRIVTKTYQHPP